MSKVILLGASGRVARMVQAVWPDPAARPLALLRDAWRDPDLFAPSGGGHEDGCILCLAGVTPRSGGDLRLNTELALAAIDAGRRWRARHVLIASSSAIYGATGPHPAHEAATAIPSGAYGHEKMRMEREVAKLSMQGDQPSVTVLRLANVAGAGEPFDSLSGGGTPWLHRFSDGSGPSRSYIGPETLARVLSRLCDLAIAGRRLPQVLNVAAPTPTPMAEIFAALNHQVRWADAPANAIQHVHLATDALERLCPLPPEAGRAVNLVREAARAGAAA